MLPFPMFSSPPTSPRNWSLRTLPLHSNRCHPERREGSAFLPILATKSFRIRTSTKCARNPFRIRTSKTQDLKLFRMNTYEITRGGGALRIQGLLFLPWITEHGPRTARHKSPATEFLRAILPPVCATECPSSPRPPAGGRQSFDHVAGNL